MNVPDDITIPPHSIKNIIHKTVQYIRRNGPEFEQKVRESNSKFTFLKDTDPYNSYYKFSLENLPNEDEADQLEQKLEKVEPVDELEFFMRDFPTISVKDLEIVQLTAQYVAQHGETNGILAIKQKYMNEPLLFAFTLPNHKWYPLFASLVKQYKLVIERKYKVLSVHDMLERCKQRALYEESQRTKEDSKKRLEEAKRLKFASVDWNDFVVVETITFDEVDLVAELALPVTIEELQLRSLDTKSKELTMVTPSNVSSGPPGMKIREAGTTRIKQQRPMPHSTGGKLIQCPISGKMIPEKDFERHIQILLRDPKYSEEKKRYEEKIKNNSSNLSVEEVALNIKNLFQSQEADDSNKRQKVLWDGYQASKDYVRQQNRATRDEVEEYKRKQREPEIGPKRR